MVPASAQDRAWGLCAPEGARVTRWSGQQAGETLGPLRLGGSPSYARDSLGPLRPGGSPPARRRESGPLSPGGSRHPA
ncbi:hypothetical protein NDU88_011393 [Pleurodeles waltl]|uniref:Uncharacterized protein n=1 Tax=Pleurodeles waltl TaxID=8319 RepID=A0AAV7S627_PLEWA|nr:hypothetical protein NDU88_011393 [Pleurodeles waltl]